MSLKELSTENRVEIVIDSEMAEQLDELFEEHLWERANGLRMLLGAGIAAMLLRREKLAGDDKEREIISLKRLLTESEGRLASVRFGLHEAQENIKHWELASGTLQSMSMALEKVIRNQADKISELKVQLKSQEQEIERLQTQLGNPADVQDIQTPTSDKKSWWAKK